MTNTQRRKLLALRAMIETLSAGADDTVAAEYPELFERWNGDGMEYKTGERVYYDGAAYKVLQDHTSQPAWNPADAPSLFAKILIPDPEVIPDWEQPDSTNPYMKGDKVRYEGRIYESLIDGNIWAPDAYPAGWRQVD